MSNEQLKIETVSEAKHRNHIKIRAFRASEYSKLHCLANKLKRCRKGKRCHLLACSVCLRRFRLCYLKKTSVDMEKINEAMPCALHFSN